MPRALLLTALALPLLSGAPLPPPEAVDAAAYEAAARPGDVVFRRGRSLVSRAVLTGDRGAAFSHVGIVARRGGALVVVHATPGADAAVPEPVRVEPLAAFFARASAEAGALRRPRDPALGRRAARAALRLASGRTFDAALDLGTDDRLYCTELVWKAYREAGADLTGGRFDYAGGLLHDGPMVFPSTLFRTPSLAPVPGLAP